MSVLCYETYHHSESSGMQLREYLFESTHYNKRREYPIKHISWMSHLDDLNTIDKK